MNERADYAAFLRHKRKLRLVSALNLIRIRYEHLNRVEEEMKVVVVVGVTRKRR